MKSKIRLYVIDNIKKRRLDNEWSQRYLGDCLNVSQGFIQKIENPKSDKSYNIDHLNELAKIFNVLSKISFLIFHYNVSLIISSFKLPFYIY